MFEDQQDAVQTLIANNETFRQLFNQHQELKEQVHNAGTGVVAMDPYALERLKKEKLLLKDRMAAILSQHVKEGVASSATPD